MAQVGQATHADIDHLLERASAAWDGLAEVEQEIDSWDLIDQIVYIEEWPIQEDRLRRLAEQARLGGFTEAQCLRYQALLRLVAERRPMIERLLKS
jgi:hypothetical protein